MTNRRRSRRPHAQRRSRDARCFKNRDNCSVGLRLVRKSTKSMTSSGISATKRDISGARRSPNRLRLRARVKITSSWPRVMPTKNRRFSSSISASACGINPSSTPQINTTGNSQALRRMQGHECDGFGTRNFSTTHKVAILSESNDFQ